jgi:hypothetical protein
MKLIKSGFHQSFVRSAGRVLFAIGFALSLFAAVETRAGNVKVTYAGSGSFVSVAPDNPFGATEPDELGFDLSFSFILPTDAADQKPADPDKARWSTMADAFITANGVTVHFAGPAIVNLQANISGFGPIAAAFIFQGMAISFASFNDDMLFPDDHAEHLLELGTQDNPFSASYVDVHSPEGTTFNDLDRLYLISVEKIPDGNVPDASSTLYLLTPAAILMFATRTRRSDRLGLGARRRQA